MFFKINYFSITVLAVTLVLLWWLSQAALSETEEVLQQLHNWTAEERELSPLFFMLGYAAAVVLLFGIPLWPLSILGGILFGFGYGVLLSLGGLIPGAVISFVSARRLKPYLTRGWIKSWIGRLERSRLPTNFLKEHQLLTVLVLRLLYPVTPLRYTNYFLGVSGVSWGNYFIGTIVGLLPSTVIFSYLGSEFPEWKPVQLVLIGLLVLIPIALGYWFHRKLARRRETLSEAGNLAGDDRP